MSALSALLRYGRHEPGCASQWRAATGSSQIGPCDCGLSAAIESEEGKMKTTKIGNVSVCGPDVEGHYILTFSTGHWEEDTRHRISRQEADGLIEALKVAPPAPQEAGDK